VLFNRRQRESTRKRLKPTIEGGICDAPEDLPVTTPVVRPSRLTDSLGGSQQVVPLRHQQSNAFSHNRIS
jgi:hypothetical protein